MILMIMMMAIWIDDSVVDYGDDDTYINNDNDVDNNYKRINNNDDNDNDKMIRIRKYEVNRKK